MRRPVHQQLRVIAAMVAKTRTRLSEGFETGEFGKDQVQQGYFFSLRTLIEAFGAPLACPVMLLNRASGVVFYGRLQPSSEGQVAFAPEDVFSFRSVGEDERQASLTLMLLMMNKDHPVKMTCQEMEDYLKPQPWLGMMGPYRVSVLKSHGR